MDYLWIIVMFLSAVWTPILTAPIHCRASIAEALMDCYTFSKSTEETNSSTSTLLGSHEGEIIFSNFSFLVELLLPQL